MTKRILLVLLGAVALVSLPQPGFASGTLFDTGVLTLSFQDQTGSTPISGDNDGTYIWTASGGGTGNPIGRYNLDGSPAGTFTPGIDFRSLYVSNGGQLYAKGFCGGVWSISQSGIATFLYNLGDPDCQSAASFSADDSELYLMVAPTLYRFAAATGAPLGSFTLNGMGGGEFGFPQYVQMETNAAGRILTYADGVVSEWDLGGNRVGQCTIPISTPTDFNTQWSFGVGNDDMVYLYNANTGQWELYDVGIATPPVATKEVSWGSLKALYR